MSSAIVIAGNGLWHLQAAEEFVKYFRDDLNASVTVIKAAYLSPEELHAELCGALRNAGTDPVVLLYAGHGSKEGWFFNDYDTYGYETLAAVLSVHAGPVLVVNDCCFSGIAADFFERAALPKDRISLIAATRRDLTCTHGIAARAIEAWHEGRILAFPQVLVKESLPFTPMYSLQRAGDVDGMCIERFVDMDYALRWGDPLDRHFFPRS